MNNRRLWIGAAIASVLLLILAYGLSPYFAAAALSSAIQSRDRDKLEQLVDFPSVRENLKADLKVKLLAKMQADPELQNNPFAGLGMMLVPTMVDQMIDAMVTPAAISTMTEEGASRLPPPGGAPPPAGEHSTKPKLALSYKGLDRFYAVATGADGSKLSFVMARQGLFTWRVKRIELPADILGKPEPIPTEPQSAIEVEPQPEPIPDADPSANFDWIPTDMPAGDREILIVEAQENELCRGGSGDDPATAAACERRDRLVQQLNAQGWCYGEGAESGADAMWARCR